MALKSIELDLMKPAETMIVFYTDKSHSQGKDLCRFAVNAAR